MTEVNETRELVGDSFWGEPIFSYSRAQALEDGVLIDVTKTGKEAGFKWPVAMTRAAYADTVEWPERLGASQDESGRLWDVLFLASFAVKTSKKGGSELLYKLGRVPREYPNSTAREVTLKLVVSPGDTPEPVITIMLPGED